MSLIKTAARVAVASSVHGRVQQRQQRRWAATNQWDQTEYRTENRIAPAQTAVTPAPAHQPGDRLAALQTLGELRASGVLTDAEFEAEKRKIL